MEVQAATVSPRLHGGAARSLRRRVRSPVCMVQHLGQEVLSPASLIPEVAAVGSLTAITDTAERSNPSQSSDRHAAASTPSPTRMARAARGLAVAGQQQQQTDLTVDVVVRSDSAEGLSGESVSSQAQQPLPRTRQRRRPRDSDTTAHTRSTTPECGASHSASGEAVAPMPSRV